MEFRPVRRVGCYVPAGRHPLPSSALMTGITAKVAGVPEIWIASPRPSREIAAAAALCGARGLIAAGGAQAIAAFAEGCGPMPPCDLIVGPGNRYVTAAKYLVSRRVRIDMLAGPSELAIVADDTARPDWVAADLLAQAEHDRAARVYLISMDRLLTDRVEECLRQQVSLLSTAATAEAALERGIIVEVEDLEEAVRASDAIAPEHLALHVRQATQVRQRFSNFGGLFVGENAAEVFGDYGAGPNHVLPTGGSGRSRGGLSVLDFLCLRSWMHIADRDAAQAVLRDCGTLAELEGLPGHAQSALIRQY